MHRLVWFFTVFFAGAVVTGNWQQTVSVDALSDWRVEWAFVAHALGLFSLAVVLQSRILFVAGLGMLLAVAFPSGHVLHAPVALTVFVAVALAAWNTRHRTGLPLLSIAVVVGTLGMLLGAVGLPFAVLERVSALTNSVWECAAAWVIFKGKAGVVDT